MTPTASRSSPLKTVPLAPETLDACAQLGLAPGVPLGEWLAERLERTEPDNKLLVTFARGDARITVVLKQAEDRPRFARVGTIDLSHLPVTAPADNFSAGQVTGAVAECLKKQGDGAILGRHLAPAPAVASATIKHTGGATASPKDSPGDHSLDVIHEAPPLDFQLQAPPDAPVFPHAAADISELAPFRDALGAMYRHQFGCIVVRGVYTKDEMARLARALDDGAAYVIHSLEADSTLEKPPEDEKQSRLFGRPLDWATSVDEYLNEAQVFRERLNGIFDRLEIPHYETRIQEVFRKLSGDRPVESPRSRDGRNYGLATLRYLARGGRYTPHVENHITKPNYAELRETIDEVGHLSHFLTVQEAEGLPTDGSLIVYSVVFDGREFSERTDDAGRLELARWSSFKPEPGDLLIFDAGRYTHQVSKIVTARTRITIGGFLMFTKDNKKVHYMR